MEEETARHPDPKKKRRANNEWREAALSVPEVRCAREDFCAIRDLPLGATQSFVAQRTGVRG